MSRLVYENLWSKRDVIVIIIVMHENHVYFDEKCYLDKSYGVNSAYSWL